MRHQDKKKIKETLPFLYFNHLKSSFSITSDAKVNSTAFFLNLACRIFSIVLHATKLFQGKILIEDKHNLM